MDPDREVEVFSDTEEPQTFRAEEEEDGGEEEEEEEDEDEEEDARIFNAWMQLYRRGERAVSEEDGAGGESEGGRAESRSSIETPVRMRSDRRASLPCPVRKHIFELFL